MLVGVDITLTLMRYGGDSQAVTGQYTSNKYVIWNYNTNVWSIGSMDRGAWVDQGAFTYPIAGDSLGFVYEHESTTPV